MVFLHVAFFCPFYMRRIAENNQIKKGHASQTKHNRP